MNIEELKLKTIQEFARNDSAIILPMLNRDFGSLDYFQKKKTYIYSKYGIQFDVETIDNASLKFQLSFGRYDKNLDKRQENVVDLSSNEWYKDKTVVSEDIWVLDNNDICLLIDLAYIVESDYKYGLIYENESTVIPNVVFNTKTCELSFYGDTYEQIMEYCQKKYKDREMTFYIKMQGNASLADDMSKLEWNTSIPNDTIEEIIRLVRVGLVSEDTSLTLKLLAIFQNIKQDYYENILMLKKKEN